MGKEEMSNLPDETLTYPPKCDDLYMFYFQEAEVNLFSYCSLRGPQT